MNIPDGVEPQIIVFCNKRSPIELADKLKISYNIERNSITISEDRPYWQDPSRWTSMPIAKMSFIKGKWTLYCCLSDGKWRKYQSLSPNENIEVLLQEIDKDPTGIFWG